MGKLRHLFWDFDGTLYDSYPLVTSAFCKTLSELELSECLQAGEALPLLKVSVYHAACRCAERSGVSAERIMTVFRKWHAQERDFTPYTGMKECLIKLHEAGFRHYLYTHRDASAIEQLKLDGLWPLFSDAVLRTDGFADKPAPDALLALVRRNGLAPEECAMIGDRDIDIQAGHNAGMQGILFDPDDFYPQLQAEKRVRTMQQLQAELLAE